MATIQPDEIPGLSELFAEVKALRQEVDFLKSGRQPAQPLDLQTAHAPLIEAPDAQIAERDESEPLSMTPEEIRERVGRVVGERRDDPPVVTSEKP